MTMNFFRIFQESEKHDFEVRKQTFAPKLLKKFIEVYIFMKNDDEFFQNFQIQYALQKNPLG